MNTLILILSSVVIPFVAGWLYGKNQIDPDSAKGIVYYEGKDLVD